MGPVGKQPGKIENSEFLVHLGDPGCIDAHVLRTQAQGVQLGVLFAQLRARKYQHLYLTGKTFFDFFFEQKRLLMQRRFDAGDIADFNFPGRGKCRHSKGNDQND